MLNCIKNLFKEKEYIFLDIDGVLNNSDDITVINGVWFPKMEKQYIDLFNKLNQSNRKIIISSTWRESLSVEELRFYFKEMNIKIKIEDKTNPDISKENSIKEYLKNHNINKYIIIEDDIDVLKHFEKEICCMTKWGLKEENILEIERKLN